MNYRKMKNALLPVIFFVCVLTIGIVYAATTGILDLGGTVVINPNAQVVFNEVHFHNGSGGYSNSVSPDGQTLSLTLPLDTDHQHSQVSVNVYNSGNVPVMLGDLTDTTPSIQGISINWPAGFKGIRLEPGEYSELQEIDVYLTDSQTLPGSFHFSATLSYEQVT